MIFLFLLSVFFFLFFPVRAWAVPAYTDGCVAFADSVTLVSCDVNASGSNRLLLAWVSRYVALSSITHDSVALTAVTTGVAHGDGGMLDLYRLTAPNTGLLTTEVNFAAPDFISIGVMTFADSDQATPLGTAATEGSGGFIASASINVASQVGDLVADGSYYFDGGGVGNTITYGAGQTERYLLETLPENYWIWSGTTAAGAAGTVNMTRAWGGASKRSALIGVAIRPAATAVGGVRRRIINQ